LADAHIKALEYLNQNNTSNEFNLGNGKGFSVREVIESVKNVTGRDFKVTETPRREGDPAVLIGSAEKAHELL
jgi:UDP-glucose 4-epimerase